MLSSFSIMHICRSFWKSGSKANLIRFTFTTTCILHSPLYCKYKCVTVYYTYVCTLYIIHTYMIYACTIYTDIYNVCQVCYIINDERCVTIVNYLYNLFCNCNSINMYLVLQLCTNMYATYALY